ncbi:MAG TPA: AI-2E family transporter [Candidatus Dormibacteraeota bacterium]|nr:AI-2E family transporter [Candidatus Dormibacteraeota bacterium]
MGANGSAGGGTDRAGWSRLEPAVRVLVYLLIALTLVLIYHFADYLVSRIFNIAVLFVFGAIIALLLNPLVDSIEALPPFRGRRGLSALALGLLLIAALAAVVALIVPELVSQASAFGNQLPDLLQRAQDAVNGTQGAIDRTGLGLHLTIPKGLDSLTGSVVGSAVQVISGAVAAVINVLLVTVISIYLMIEGKQLVVATRKLFPAEREQFFDFMVVATGSTIAAYVRGQLVMALVMGVYTGVAMSLLGVHYAVVLGVAAFFLEFLPLIGAPVAMALAVLVALFQGPVVAVLAAAAGLGGHAIEAYIIGPRVTGHATRLHPLAAMAALLIGAEVGGVLGALFAVPLAGIVNVFLGALYRGRRGEEAFVIPDGGDVHDQLPRLGDEITNAVAEDEAQAAEVEVEVAVVTAPARRRRTPKPAASASRSAPAVAGGRSSPPSAPR